MDFDAQKEIDSVIRGIMTVIENEPQLRKNILQIAAEKVKQNAISYIGTSGPAIAPWKPLAEKTVKNKGHALPLFETGEMQSNIDVKAHWGYATITSDRSKFSPSIHEEGSGRIPARPFIWPAIDEMQSDAAFWSSVLRYADENIEFMAFDKRHRVTQYFYSENKGSATKASVGKKSAKKGKGRMAKRKTKKKGS